MASWRSMTKKGSGSISQRHGSANPDPLQNVMDPQHWWEVMFSAVRIKYFISAVFVRVRSEEQWSPPWWAGLSAWPWAPCIRPTPATRPSELRMSKSKFCCSVLSVVKSVLCDYSYGRSRSGSFPQVFVYGTATELYMLENWEIFRSFI